MLTIDHTGTNGSLNVDLTGQGITGGGNVAPTAAFTHDATLLSVDFTDASSDSDGSIVSWDWDFGDGNSSTEQNPVHAFAAAGTYAVSLTVTDDGGLTDTDTQDVTVSEGGGGTGAFLEAGGQVVFEAENYHGNTPHEDHSWVADTGQAGFSGSSAMQAQP